MTNYEKYNEFLIGKVKPNNSTFNKSLKLIKNQTIYIRRKENQI